MLPHFLQLKCFMFHLRLPVEQTGFIIQTEITSMLSLLFTASCKYTLSQSSARFVVWERRQRPLWHHTVDISKTASQYQTFSHFQVLNRIFLEDHVNQRPGRRSGYFKLILFIFSFVRLENFKSQPGATAQCKCASDVCMHRSSAFYVCVIVLTCDMNGVIQSVQ